MISLIVWLGLGNLGYRDGEPLIPKMEEQKFIVGRGFPGFQPLRPTVLRMIEDLSQLCPAIAYLMGVDLENR